MDFDFLDCGVLLRAPWVSAHAQGFVIGAIVRGWRLTKKPHLRELLQGSADIFDLDVSRGGIHTQIDGSTFYTERPGGALPGVDVAGCYGRQQRCHITGQKSSS